MAQIRNPQSAIRNLMSTPAHVYSTEAIEAVRRALDSFGDQVGDALAELDGEMRRVADWLEHERPRFWKAQIRLAMDRVHEAQQALHRCLMFPIANERPSCYEERAALKKAQARLAYCEEKAERVRHWQRVVEHELFEYEGRISQLVRMVEEDVPQSLGVLAKLLRHLEDYQAVRAAEPRAAYNDLAVAEEIWPESDDASENNTALAEDANDEKDVRHA
jgi:exonuclease VII large subunit